MKKIIKRLACLVMAAAVATASVTIAPANQSIFAATTVEFGTAKTVLSEGTYTVPVSLLKEDKSGTSMANGCLDQTGTLTVNTDGTASIELGLSSMTMMMVTAWATDWKSYTDNDESKDKIDSQVVATDENGNVTRIKMNIPDVTDDGLYVNMTVNIGASKMSPNAFVKIDYANAVAVATEQPSTEETTEQPSTEETTEQPSTEETTEQPSTEETTEQPSTEETTEQPATTKKAVEIKDGKYTVNVSALKTDFSSKSMCSSAFDTAVIEAKSGVITATVTVKPVTVGTVTAYLGSLKPFLDGYTVNSSKKIEGTLGTSTVVTTQKDTAGTEYPASVSFTVITQALTDGYAPVEITVPAMATLAGSATQQLVLMFDWTSLKEYVEPEKKTATASFEATELTKKYGDDSFINKLTTDGDGAVTYTSDNESVATVDAQGNVTMVGTGVANITAAVAEGTNYKTVSASYKLTVNPGKATISSVKKAGKKKIKVTLKNTAVGKSTKDTTYYVSYSTSKKFTKKTTKTVKVAGTKKSVTISKLKKNKKYYVRVRAYSKSLKKYGSYSKVKTIKVK